MSTGCRRSRVISDAGGVRSRRSAAISRLRGSSPSRGMGCSPSAVDDDWRILNGECRRMTSESGMVRLGAVTYLNARPLVYGLERSERFSIRYDIPSECSRLLHERETDVGLIPSIEYLRGIAAYSLVPGPAVTSR